MIYPARLHVAIPVIEHVNKLFIWQYGWTQDKKSNNRPLSIKQEGSPTKRVYSNKTPTSSPTKRGRRT